MKPLRFGVRYDFRNPLLWRRDWREHYDRLFEQAVYMDELGFDSIWLTEHHFTDDGYCPGILPLLGALAARTTRVRLGTGILLLPQYHPLRLAEDIATLDLISHGRIDLGIAAGYRPLEFDVQGIPLRERGTRMNEGIELLKRAWTNECVIYHGNHYTFEGIAVEPKPLQVPHPPLWMGGESPAAIRRAVTYDCHYMPTTTGDSTITAFRNEITRQGKDPAAFKIALPRVVYIRNDPEAGWNEVKEHLLYQHNVYCQWSAEAGMRRHDGGVMLESPEQLPRQNYLIGPPATCIAALERLQEQWNLDEIILWAVLPGFDVDRATRSLERFANEVMPYFR